MDAWISFSAVGLSAFAQATVPQAAQASADVVLYASNAPVRSGTWSVLPDRSAASGYAIGNPVLGAPKLSSPQTHPTNYFELTFSAYAGQPYQLWLRGKSLGQSSGVYVQFSDSVTADGSLAYRIGSQSATSVSFSACSALAGWGWHGSASCALGQPIYFGHTGTHTMRLQVQQDGLLLDQIVLSPHAYLASAPGQSGNDTTLLRENLPQLSTATNPTASNNFAAASPLTSYSTTSYSTSATAVPLKVMEANISYGGHGTDNIINLSRLVGWIQKMNPDVASLIETIGGYNDPALITSLLKQKTGITWYSFYVPKYAGCAEGVMILSKWKIVSTAQYFMSYQMPIAEASINVNGKVISFFSTHFQWPKTASSERVTEANQLVSFANKFPEPRIIAGDFNAQEGTPEISIIEQQYLDAWDIAVNAKTSVAYVDNPPDLYTRTRRSRIDHVFYARSASTVSVSGGQVPDQRNLNVKPVILVNTLDDKGVRPSDHNYMSISFSLQ